MAHRAQPSIVLAPDKFKGSLTAPGVCDAIARGLVRVWPDADVRACPMADGGDGTLDAVLSRGGLRATRSVTGAGGAPRTAAYGVLDAPEGRTAVLEVAQIVGITDPDGMAVPVAQRTTRGVGELVRALLDDGVRRFMIGLGGSSTNDGGAGMLAALGLAPRGRARRARRSRRRRDSPRSRASTRRLDPRLGDAAITIMSDVNNPLCGDRGRHGDLRSAKRRARGRDRRARRDARAFRGARGAGDSAVTPPTNPGAGAAGGLGFALQLVGGAFRSGAEVVAGLVGLDAALAGADWAITGEGRTDAQTLLAKAPVVVALHARAARRPRHAAFGRGRFESVARARQNVRRVLRVARRTADARRMHRRCGRAHRRPRGADRAPLGCARFRVSAGSPLRFAFRPAAAGRSPPGPS